MVPTILRRHIGYVVLYLLCTLLLGACGSVPVSTSSDAAATRKPGVKSASSTASGLPPAKSGRGGYYQDDGPGDQTPEGLLDTPDAEPKVEPYARTGNKPYVVFGKTYTPAVDERPYKQRGRGSWYGKKFHGQRTSSGERYDMYKMTAAHPTLPIPSYARVTNLANGKQVIVRVNDRGPFLHNRIIDLSYTAALKLGYLHQGSAELEVERLLPEEIQRMTANRKETVAAAKDEQPPVQPALPVSNSAMVQTVAYTEQQPARSMTHAFSGLAPGYYLQLGSYTQATKAEAARQRLQQIQIAALPPIEVQPNGTLFRLYSGPFANRAEAAAAAAKIQESGSTKPIIVQR